MNGWQLAEEVRRAWPSVGFVLASGSVGIDAAEARAHGVDALLEKPYQPEDLHRVVANVADPTIAKAA
jgi:CheY-like chemotaxis protein